jgi:hypothetical protein
LITNLKILYLQSINLQFLVGNCWTCWLNLNIVYLHVWGVVTHEFLVRQNVLELGLMICNDLVGKVQMSLVTWSSCTILFKDQQKENKEEKDGIMFIYLVGFRLKIIMCTTWSEHDDYSSWTPQKKWHLNGKHSCN